MFIAPIANGAAHTLFPAVAGAVIVALILWETFETVVLPRRVARRFRFTVLVYRSMWLPWKAVARGFRGKKARETFLSFFGPLSLLILFGHDPLKHALEINVHLLHADIGKNLHRNRPLFDI